MQNIEQYPLNKRFAEDSGSRIDPTADAFKNGIDFLSEVKSTTLNGDLYKLSQSIQYLQFSGGLYDKNANYHEGNVVSCLVKDGSKYRFWFFRRNGNNASTLNQNPPIQGGSVNKVNGIDVYTLGSVNSNWDKLEDFNYTSEPTANYIIQRDSSGSAKVKMPSSVVSDTIVNKSYLKAINVSFEDNKGLGFTHVQGAIEKVADRTKTNENNINSLVNRVKTLESKFLIPLYYVQYPTYIGYSWTFDDAEAPDKWYLAKYGVKTTWQLKFNDQSFYFRTEGTLANNGRSNGLQSDTGKNATGYLGNTYDRNQSGVFKKNTDSTYGQNGNYYACASVSIEMSKQWSVSNEFRTRNVLIRVFILLTINGKKI